MTPEANENNKAFSPSYLLAISFLSLFIELALIRWIGSEIRIFAFFKNLALISCFIGLGIGFSYRETRYNIYTTVLLLLGLVVVAHPGTHILGVNLRNVPTYMAKFSDFHMWYSWHDISTNKVVAGFVMTTAVMATLAWTFVPFGQILGEIFEKSANRIKDYSINLVGSLLGTWAFVIFSYLNTPPWMWFLFGAGAAILIMERGPKTRKTLYALCALIPILYFSMDQNKEDNWAYWSPYQRINLVTKQINEKVSVKLLQVNSVFYMWMIDLSDAQFTRFPEVYKKSEAPYYSYDFPYRFHAKPDRVLVVGSGAGNDVAGALRNGAKHVDAVEIDPIIAKLGTLYHPERPYSDPRVSLHVDDGRSFFKKTKNKYDLITFGLLDSHTVTSNFTNINLDSYIYTKESIQEAKSLLADGGIIALSFEVRTPWLGLKIYKIIEEVFGSPPMVFWNYGQTALYGTGGTLFICGNIEGAKKLIESNAELKSYATKLAKDDYYKQIGKETDFDVPTDNWPYIYLQTHRMPSLQIIMIAITIALMFFTVRKIFPNGKIGASHFLFLGAGFMLVEVHSISKVALLFGSTWIVNAVIISAILVMILCANVIVLKFNIENLKPWYACLFAILAVSYLVPVGKLLIGGYAVRGILAGTIYSMPMLFAGVIFAVSMRKVKNVEQAFASNMLGSAVGGMLECLSYVMGLKAVVLIAILLYAASYVAMNKNGARGAAGGN